MKEDFSIINFHKLIFSEAELISFCNDSIGQNKFDKEILKLKKRFDKIREGDRKESIVVCNILFNRIREVKLSDVNNKGKTFIEERLKEFKINFPVDEEFLLERFDGSKRGMIYGDDECSISYSMCIFLIYDPILYKNVFQNNKSISNDGTVFLPLKCTLKEEDGLLPIREVIQKELVKMLGKHTDPAFNELNKRIRNSELEETHD